MRGIHGCIEYTYPPPRPPEDAEKPLEEAVARPTGMDDNESNKLVVEHTLLPRLPSNMYWVKGAST